MSSVSRGNVKMAVTALKSTKWRSLFTMLGVIIGVVSVVTVVGIGEGIKDQVGGQINQLGRDLITIRPGKLVNRSSGGGITGVNLFTNTTSGGSLTQKDLAKVQQTNGVRLAVPLGLVNGTAQTSAGQPASLPIVATTSDLPSVLNQSVSVGGFFAADTTEQPYVAVIGSSAAQTLFHQSDPLGRSFQFMGHTFFVQGIFNQFDTNPLSLTTDFNDAIFIPYSTAQLLTNNNTQLYEILAKPDNSKQTDAVVRTVTNTLTQAYQNQQQFTVLSQDESLTVTNNILDLLTKLIAGVAAISLLVGGIGIMDVMLVSVSERMHEVGIRKALGATNRQILEQFLIESTVLSLAGGLIGIIMSLLIDYLLRVFTTLTPIISWQAVVVATLVSFLVGIVFGSVPAIKAARKDPIDALRNE
jgi:ABC-type antimicrobial peptide transport system permease subunit